MPQAKEFWAQCVAATARLEPDLMAEFLLKKIKAAEKRSNKKKKPTKRR